ncbi:unnamed protein product [marine sediment metagenome]|uniref:Uncharacterized protein n=1 Tax=marine sediment metagenome TaxID=412755 RepID=X0Y6X9_9ZZZZ
MFENFQFSGALEKLKSAGFPAVSIDAKGIVLDVDGNHLQDDPGIAAIITGHDPGKIINLLIAAKDQIKALNGTRVKSTPDDKLIVIIFALIYQLGLDWVDEDGNWSISND